MKLVKDGKQSILTYNDSKSYKDLGNVIDTVNNRIRVPVNHRIREAFEGLKPHLLIIAGYWNPSVIKGFNFELGTFEPDEKNNIPITPIAQMQNTSVNYCYNNNGVIALKGKMRILDSMSTIDIDIKDIKETYEYAFHSLLENQVEELFSAIEEWDENRFGMDKAQMAMSFVEIDNNLTSMQAEQMLANMDEDERNELVMKQMLKFTVAVNEMEGTEIDDEPRRDPFKEIVVEVDEDDEDEFRSIADAPKTGGKRKEVISKKKPAKEAEKPKFENLASIEEDEFADIDGNVVPMI